MIEVLIRNADRIILNYGWGLVADDSTTVLTLDLADALAAAQVTMQPVDSLRLELDSATVTVVPGTPLPPAPPAPDLKGLIAALTSSPSIDQATKNALVAALQGQ